MFEQLEKNTGKNFHHEKGVTYFSRRTERTIFFIMTLAMLGWGIVEALTGQGSLGG